MTENPGLGSLGEFLVQANRAGYAAGEDRSWIKEGDSSTSIRFESGDWRMHDNFFGGEPYGGRILVFRKEKPVWMTAYYGWVEADAGNPDSIYAVLRKALMQMPEAFPVRGPEHMKWDDYSYSFVHEGGLDRFSGEEVIFRGGGRVYAATFIGGLVDCREGI